MRPRSSPVRGGAFAFAALMTSALLAAPGTGGAQSAAATTQATALASRSPIVLSGTVVRLKASDEPLLAPSAATAVVKIDRILSGTDLVGDQSGRTATVILRDPNAVKPGSRALFFGNLRFAGKTITVADVGELPYPAGGGLTPALEAAVSFGTQSRRDAPVRARLAAADLVFRGTVESERPLEPTDASPAQRRFEHDPEWHIASVRATSPIRGAQRGTVYAIVFPA